MTDAWRCFVAIPMPDELRDRLASAVERWRATDAPDGLRWTDPVSWHVTLAFLGATDPRSVPRLDATVRNVAARHAPLRLPLEGIGAFPSERHARVVWAGIGDPDGELARLHADLTMALGLEASGPFRPHVTLARAAREPVGVRAPVFAVAAPLVVDDLQLLRSRLGGRLERYEVLVAAPMGEPARV